MAIHKILQEKDAASSAHIAYPLSARSLRDERNASSPGPDEPPHATFSMNNTIGWILQGGVVISSAVIGVGIVLWMLGIHRQSGQQLLVFPHTLGEVGSGLLSLHPQAIITLGLLLLLATPVVRVFASIFAFALEHDRRYVVITSVVLTILLVSFLLGKGAG